MEALVLLLWFRLVVIWWLGLAFLKDQSENSNVLERDPQVSVVIPAFNEADLIVETLRSLRASSLSPREVILVDDGSRDQTADLAQAELKAFDRGLLLKHPFNVGKAAALNTALQECQYDLVLTLDADTRLEPDALAAAASWLEAKNVDAVGFLIETTRDKRWITQCQQQEYLSSLNVERAGQAILGTISILPGAATLFRRSVFQGIRYSSHTRTEDADLTLSLSRRGLSLHLAKAAKAVTYVPTSLPNLLRQRCRWMTGHLQCGWQHWLTKDAASLRFRLFTLPNFALSTLVAPLSVLVLFFLMNIGRTCLLGLGWIHVLLVSSILIYSQRLICWILIGETARPAIHVILFEPLISGLVGSLSFLMALIQLFLGHVRHPLNPGNARGWKSAR
jgi:cellulose synthase/poly-beta-1,6-N-acetylglucosamine synthase-like glycosyltransferase